MPGRFARRCVERLASRFAISVRPYVVVAQSSAFEAVDSVRMQDYTGRTRSPRRRRQDDPHPDTEGKAPRLDKAGRQQPQGQAAAAARRAGGDARVLRGVRQLLPRRRHRVLLLRPARLGLQRPAQRSVAPGDPALRRRSRAGAAGARRYMELLVPHHYVQHLLRMPAAQWPDPVNRAFQHLNRAIYVPMQGPSELGASGKILTWDRTADLGKIAVPTLVIGARYDTMDPAQMERIAKGVKKGRYLFCPNGSHLAIYDDQKVYVGGIINFIQDVDAGRF